MFQKFSFKFVPLLFRQYDQLHGKWQDTSLEQPVTSTVIIETQNDVKAPVPPPMPQSSLQLPAGGIGEGGSAERLAIMLEAATTCVLLVIIHIFSLHGAILRLVFVSILYLLLDVMCVCYFAGMWQYLDRQWSKNSRRHFFRDLRRHSFPQLQMNSKQIRVCEL